MLKWHWLMAAVVLGGLGMISLAGTIQAEEKEKPLSDEELQAQIVKYLGTAADVEDFGRKNKAPEALVSAAGLFLKVNALTKGKLAKLDAAVEDEKGNKLDVPAEEEMSYEAQANKLFGDARNLGAALDLRAGTVEALIKAAKARDYSADDEFKGRGAVGGPKRISRQLQAGGLHVYTITFKARRPAAIAFRSNVPARLRIISPGQGDLSNNIVTSWHYNWTPGRQVAIKVHVQNMGRKVHYTLTTN